MPNRIDTIYHPGALEALTAALKRLDRVATAVLTAMFKARQRAAQRHMLAKLDDRMLKDLGLTRCDVEREISKRFWQE